MLTFHTAMIDSTENQTKFEQIYYSYRKQMHYAAFQVTHDNGLAEDAVQEALLSIAQNIDHIRTDKEKLLRAYVLTAAKSRAINIMKKEKIIKDAEYYSTDEATMQSLVATYSYLDNCLENDLINAETKNEVIDVVQNLPYPYAEALMLKYVHELEMDEIAEVLNASVGTVYQWLSRGRKKVVKIVKGATKHADMF